MRPYVSMCVCVCRPYECVCVLTKKILSINAVIWVFVYVDGSNNLPTLYTHYDSMGTISTVFYHSSSVVVHFNSELLQCRFFLLSCRFCFCFEVFFFIYFVLLKSHVLFTSILLIVFEIRKMLRLFFFLFIYIF